MTHEAGTATRAEAPGAYRAAIGVIRPVMRALTRRDWSGGENLPETGGVVVCANHVSYADPLAVAHFLVDHGRRPVFLAKASLFTIPLLGRWIAACGQVPVHRGDRRAADAYRDAVAAVQAGQCVVVMPESTVTKDPDHWPMTAKSGAARIALATGVPVLPLAQWGAQELLGRDRRLHPTRRPVVSMRLGPPVSLSDLRGRPVDRELLREATDRIMGAILAGVEDLRGESAPAGAWDVREGRRVPGTSVRRDSPAFGGPPRPADSVTGDPPRTDPSRTDPTVTGSTGDPAGRRAEARGSSAGRGRPPARGGERPAREDRPAAPPGPADGHREEFHA